MKTIGRHLIAEYYDCDTAIIQDVDHIRAMMLKAAAEVGATVMGEVFQRYSPQGVSGAVVIAESHLSIHTWPEAGYVAVDIFTCGGLDPRPGFDYLGRELRAASCRVQEILRGVADEIEADRHLFPDDVQVVTRTSDAVQLHRPVPAE